VLGALASTRGALASTKEQQLEVLGVVTMVTIVDREAFQPRTVSQELAAVDMVKTMLTVMVAVAILEVALEVDLEVDILEVDLEVDTGLRLIMGIISL